MKSHWFSQRLKLRYITITVLVTLLACSLIGSVLWRISSAEFRRVAVQTVNEQLDSIVEDIDEQWMMMRNISFSISTDITFRKNYFEQNPYYEIELLKNLSSYKKEVYISESYFFMYKNDNRVYSSGESKYDFDVFLKTLNIQDDPQQLHDVIDDVGTYAAIGCTVHNKPACILTFPIHVAGVQGKETAAVLCFLVTESSLKNRITMHEGFIKSPTYLLFDRTAYVPVNAEPAASGVEGLLLYTDKTGIDNTSKRFVKISSDGQITVILDIAPEEIRVPMPTFIRLNTLHLFLAAVLAVLLAILAGYMIYSPINKLYRKFNIESGPKSNELQAIEAMLEDFKNENDRYKGDLESQYVTIKDQLLYLVLSGNKYYADLAASSFMGIRLQGPYYQIIVYKCPHEPDREQELQIIAAVEDMSDNEAQQYMPRIKYQGYYVILVSLREDTDTGTLFEYINELFEPSSICGYSARFNDIHAVPDYLALAIMDSRPANEWHADDARILNEAEMSRMTTALKRGSRDEALYLFRSCIEEMRNRDLPETAERYGVSILFNRIVKAADERKTPVRSEMFYRIISSRDASTMISEIETVIAELCSQPSDSEEHNTSNDRSERIVQYLENNYSDKELTLEGLAEIFDLSDKYISALIKSTTGYTYKEYLIKLRIDKAKELLTTTDKNVTEICFECGYSHVPHFIKTFKGVTGYTPSVYKARNECGGQP